MNLILFVHVFKVAFGCYAMLNQVQHPCSGKLKFNYRRRQRRMMNSLLNIRSEKNTRLHLVPNIQSWLEWKIDRRKMVHKKLKFLYRAYRFRCSKNYNRRQKSNNWRWIKRNNEFIVRCAKFTSAKFQVRLFSCQQSRIKIWQQQG